MILEAAVERDWEKKINMEEEDIIPASQAMVESDAITPTSTPPSSPPPSSPPPLDSKRKWKKAVRKMKCVSLEKQLEVLETERGKALTDLALLRRCVEKGQVNVEDLNISLMPVINHQIRTNESLDRLVKRVFHHEAEKLLTSAIADIEGSTLVTTVDEKIDDPTPEIDEVDLIDGGAATQGK